MVLDDDPGPGDPLRLGQQGGRAVGMMEDVDEQGDVEMVVRPRDLLAVEPGDGMSVFGRTSTSMPSMLMSGRSARIALARVPLPQPMSSTFAPGGMNSARLRARTSMRRPNTALSWALP
jgi:hypothetical protein